MPRATRMSGAERVARVKRDIVAELTPTEQQHARLLESIRIVLPQDAMIFGDTCQLVYTGTFMLPVKASRRWQYPTGFCTLGCGLPNAIGAKVALPDTPVIALAGDGGFMFTLPELILAAELQLALPVIIWNNEGLQQIRDDMQARQLPRVGVHGLNPDFMALAGAFRCAAAAPTSLADFQQTLTRALSATQPTIIEVREHSDWLCASA